MIGRGKGRKEEGKGLIQTAKKLIKSHKIYF